LDIHYKTIPTETLSDRVQCFDLRYDDPVDVWTRHTNAFNLSYLVDSNSHVFHHHEIDKLDSRNLPLDCLRVKLTPSLIDALLKKKSKTFEEEIYRFLMHLNTDLPKIASLINLDFMQSTRFLPQFIRMWTYKYTTCPIEQSTVGEDVKLCFGPPSEKSVLPVRFLRGGLSPCTSRKTLLSLNDDIAADLSTPVPYTMHYSTHFNTLIPLAYNPLENPILV
jgi:hypothetical protein